MVEFFKGFSPESPEECPEYLQWLGRRLEAAFASIEGGGAGSPTDPVSGQWTLLDNTDISGSPANYTYTWDESLFNEIKVKFSGLQPATDAVSLLCRLGSGDGGTIYSGVSDYDGAEKLYGDTAWLDTYYPASEMRIATSFGDQPGETGSGDILITAFDDADVGALLRADLLYVNSVVNQRGNEVRVALDNQNVVIDTVQLLWSSSALFANTGNIRVYGLGK